MFEAEATFAILRTIRRNCLANDDVVVELHDVITMVSVRSRNNQSTEAIDVVKHGHASHLDLVCFGERASSQVIVLIACERRSFEALIVRDLTGKFSKH